MLVFALVSLGLPVKAEETPATVFDFGDRSRRGQWSSVNDGVMGGISSGRSQITSAGTLRFLGELSLANNGGFASVRSRTFPAKLRPDDEILLRVRGDGRRYYLDLRDSTNRMAFSYRVALPTKAGQWQEFRIPLRLFAATSFGRVLRNAAPVRAERVRSIGFTIADKQPGPFELQVAWIKVARPEPKKQDATPQAT